MGWGLTHSLSCCFKPFLPTCHHSFPLWGAIPEGWVSRNVKNKPDDPHTTTMEVMEGPTTLHDPTGECIPTFPGSWGIKSAAFILHVAGLMNRRNKFEEGPQEHRTSIWDLLAIAEQVDVVQHYSKRSLTGPRMTFHKIPERNEQTYCT